MPQKNLFMLFPGGLGDICRTEPERLKDVFDRPGTAALRDCVRMGEADGAGPDRPDPVADAVGGGSHRQDPGRDRGVVRERGGESRLRPPGGRPRLPRPERRQPRPSRASRSRRRFLARFTRLLIVPMSQSSRSAASM